MLTGDNAGVARAIADQIGIEEVIAGVLPEEKAHEIHKLQATGKVAFVGDGINDAPALSVADVGIAMGAGTDIAIESADLVLTTNNLLGVVRAFDMSKKTFNRILLNLFWAFYLQCRRNSDCSRSLFRCWTGSQPRTGRSSHGL